MTPRSAHVWHLPWLLGALWAFTRHTAWLPAVRPWWVDARLMGQVVRRGWVRHLGKSGFIARDGDRIHALYVHPLARRQGVGQLLLDEAKQSRDRLELWVLAHNNEARRFYVAQGFAEILCCPSGLGNDERLPDILMVWTRPKIQKDPA